MKKQSFISKYIFSIDHKVVGIQYLIGSLLFLLFGFILILIMRWQLAYPGEAIPIIGKLFGEEIFPGGVLTPELYNGFGAMHGTIMVFLAVVPLLTGAFGNYLVPLQVGAIDMAFPRLNMASFWTYFIGGLIMVSAFFVPGGPPQAGWTSYPPLAILTSTGQTVWLCGLIALITSSLLGAINIVVTIVQLRAPGMSMMDISYFCWTQLITAMILLLAFPPLEAAGVLQLFDRIFGSSMFMPSGLVIEGAVSQVSGGGSPLLWQHLFWFLGHPEVYVLILPAFGMIGEIITTNTRRPLWGYKTLIKSAMFLAFMSMLVWAHHMFLTGMSTVISAFFQITTMIVSIPSVINLTSLLLTLWGSEIRFNTPMLFALSFLPMFAIGGLTGLPLGLAVSDIFLHDTYYVIGHFHYVVAPGTIFAIFGAIYFWFPKVTGRMMSEKLGKIHFWGSLIAMNGVFFPMLIMGLKGVSRRLYDGGITYNFANGVQGLNIAITMSALTLLVFQLVFIFNFFYSIWKGKKAPRNPWESTGIEWICCPSPPVGHGNFDGEITQVINPPYQYRTGPSGEDQPMVAWPAAEAEQEQLNKEKV